MILDSVGWIEEQCGARTKGPFHAAAKVNAAGGTPPGRPPSAFGSQPS